MRKSVPALLILALALLVSGAFASSERAAEPVPPAATATATETPDQPQLSLEELFAAAEQPAESLWLPQEQAASCSQVTPCNTVNDCPCGLGECYCVYSPGCGFNVCLCRDYCFWGPNPP